MKLSLSVLLHETVAVSNDTEGYITGLAFPWCECPFFVHLVAALAGPVALCGFLAGICNRGNGSYLVHSTQLRHQFNQEVLVHHVLHLFWVGDLTGQDVGVCCCTVHKVQEQGTTPVSNLATGGVILDELV